MLLNVNRVVKQYELIAEAKGATPIYYGDWSMVRQKHSSSSLQLLIPDDVSISCYPRQGILKPEFNNGMTLRQII